VHSPRPWASSSGSERLQQKLEVAVAPNQRAELASNRGEHADAKRVDLEEITPQCGQHVSESRLCFLEVSRRQSPCDGNVGSGVSVLEVPEVDRAQQVRV
jgi:hypothetical protein